MIKETANWHRWDCGYEFGVPEKGVSNDGNYPKWLKLK